MNQWTLLGDGRAWDVSSSGVSKRSLDNLDGKLPLVFSPAIVFRKHFQVSNELEAEPEPIYREMFASYLPGESDRYLQQFIHLGKQASKDDILGLAVESSLIETIGGTEIEEVYFFEAWVAQNTADTPTHLTIPFSGGYYHAHLGDRLYWSRFIREQSPALADEAFLDNLEENDLPVPKTRQSFPSFPEQDATGKEWATEITRWLPDQLPPSPGSRATALDTIVAQTRLLRWLLVIFLVAAGITGQIYTDQFNRQVKTAQQLLFDRPELRDDDIHGEDKLLRSLEELKKQQSSDEQPFYAYPKIHAIDRGLSDHQHQWLSLSVSPESGQLTLFVSSLNDAEELRETINEQAAIASVSIDNSRTIAGHDPYQYEIDFRLGWDQP